MDIRDILENAAGHFTDGSVTNTIAEILPILKEAMQMKVSIQYDMTVRRLARVLVERSAVYQNTLPYFASPRQHTHKTRRVLRCSSH